MVTVQRKRAFNAKVWLSHEVTDRLGEKTRVVDETQTPIPVRAAFTSKRGSRAELPGQGQIQVYFMTIAQDPRYAGLDLWSQIERDGHRWDIVSPPALFEGTRHTKHLGFDIRRRP